VIPIRPKAALAASLLALVFPQLGLSAISPAGRFLCPEVRRQSAGPDWLVEQELNSGRGTLVPLGIGECGYTALEAPAIRFSEVTQGGASRVASASRPSAWKVAGIYGLEFGSAAAGSFACAVGALWTARAISHKGEVWQALAVPTGCGVYALSSAILSATVTHLVAGLLGHGESYGHALAGGAIGGVSGGAMLLAFEFSNGRTGVPCWPLLPMGIALPATGSVVSYNVWRNCE